MRTYTQLLTPEKQARLLTLTNEQRHARMEELVEIGHARMAELRAKRQAGERIDYPAISHQEDLELAEMIILASWWGYVKPAELVAHE